MKLVEQVVYRYLTNAEFFNIYKPPGTEEGGGGQSYIDFSTSDVRVDDWKKFLAGVHGVTVSTAAKGPRWQVPIHSLGISGDGYPQSVVIYQRRATSVIVAAQKVTSRESNRVQAWHPAYGFPQPANPNNRSQLPKGLAVYLAKTVDGQIWAGWFINAPGASSPTATGTASSILAPLLKQHSEGDCGVINVAGSGLAVQPSDQSTPFTTSVVPKIAAKAAKEATAATNTTDMGGAAVVTKLKASEKEVAIKAGNATPVRKPRSEEEILSGLFDEDGAENEGGDGVVEKTVKVRKRNQRAIKSLKELYGHTCQITGNKFTFKKSDGVNYTEGHHLVPLGAGGADNPRNIIIVSPLVHRMLHHAKVELFDLANIKAHEDGTSYLDIIINGETFRVRWNKHHAEAVLTAD